MKFLILVASIWLLPPQADAKAATSEERPSVKVEFSENPAEREKSEERSAHGDIDYNPSELKAFCDGACNRE